MQEREQPERADERVLEGSQRTGGLEKRRRERGSEEQEREGRKGGKRMDIKGREVESNEAPTDNVSDDQMVVGS